MVVGICGMKNGRAPSFLPSLLTHHPSLYSFFSPSFLFILFLFFFTVLPASLSFFLSFFVPSFFSFRPSTFLCKGEEPGQREKEVTVMEEREERKKK